MNRSILTGGGGPRTLPLAFFLALGLLVAGNGNPVAAQTVRGQLLDQGTLAPVEGALALLLNSRGEEIDGALTNAAGRFILRAPDAGTYTVKAERIGYETVTSNPFQLTSSQIFGLRLETGEAAIQLKELLVVGEQQCVVRPEEGLEVARVWEEARKALTLQEWTEREGLYRFQMVAYERELDASARRVERETRRVTTGVSRSPIRSLPAEELMQEGFIRQNNDGSLEYFGPDATVLLSDVFLDTHCFRLTTERDQPSSIGLAFEPVRAGGLKDVEGTLWLDRETSALQFLEYGYTWSQYQEAQGVARGRVEFEGLPNGSWIVRKWWIRMPKLAQDLTRAGGGRSGVFVAGIRETGGEITQISTMDRQRIAQAERGFVSGLVWDSTRYGPMEGARVYLSGTSYAGTTDAQGRFLIEGIPEGVFTAVFTHPRLDTLGVLAQGVDVEITPGEISDILLGVPSTGSIMVDACRGEERAWGSAVVTGTVRDQGSGQPIPRATIRLDWQEISRLGPGRIGGQNKWFETATDSEGRYTVCSVPSDELIVVQAAFLDRQSDTVSVRVLEDSYTVVNLEIILPSGMLRSSSSVAVSQGDVGIQGVQGNIREPETGEPVRDAEVALTQSPGTIRVTGTTNDRGFFRLQTRMPGNYVLSARALGFSEIQDAPVEVLPGKLTVLDVQMAPEALELEPLVIIAEARTYHLEMQGFYERQAKGLDTGIFLTPELIERRMPRRVTDLFYGLMGTRVVETQIGEQGVYFRVGERFSSGGMNICWPMVYLDRHLIRTGGLGGDPAALNELAKAFDLAAIEIYRSAAEIPPQFNGPNAGCGVIVLWTKQGGSGG